MPMLRPWPRAQDPVPASCASRRKAAFRRTMCGSRSARSRISALPTSAKGATLGVLATSVRPIPSHGTSVLMPRC